MEACGLVKLDPTMNTTRAAKLHAVQKTHTWAARLNDKQEEKSHFDRLPLHLQLHIREIAKEAFAREQMDWNVRAELLFAVARRKLMALKGCVVELEAITATLNMFNRRVADAEGVDNLLFIDAYVSWLLMRDWSQQKEKCLDTHLEVFATYSQLQGLVLCLQETCPPETWCNLRKSLESFDELEFDPVNDQAKAAGRIIGYDREAEVE